MHLIIISTPERIKNEHLIVNELFKNGMEIFHLRKPNWDIHEMEKLLLQIDIRFHEKIVLHSHYNLCRKYNLKGIHFTGKTKNLAQSYSQWNIHKSISTHSLEEINKTNEEYDYIFLSPFFDSVSKESYKSEFNLKEIKYWLNDTSCNIVALGGITPPNIEKIDNFNLWGMAVLGYIWKNNSIEQIIKAFKEIKSCFQECRQANLKHE